jgi:hypothetical protein
VYVDLLEEVLDLCLAHENHKLVPVPDVVAMLKVREIALSSLEGQSLSVAKGRVEGIGIPPASQETYRSHSRSQNFPLSKKAEAIACW